MAKAKPGALNYSSAGLGSTTGIAGELFKQTTGTDIVHVPFRGLPESHTAVIRGDVAMGFTFFSRGGDLILSGKVRALAVTGPNRLSVLPDVPTFKEAGVPEFQYDSWFGILALAGTPKPIVAKISQDIAAGPADARGQDSLRAAGGVPGQQLARAVRPDPQERRTTLCRALQGVELAQQVPALELLDDLERDGNERPTHHACRRA